MNNINAHKRESMINFLCLLPGLIVVFVFAYLPIGGWIIAFTDYQPGISLSDCNYVGLKYFTHMFNNPIASKQIAQVLINTIAMFGLGLLNGPISIAFAIFLNEMRSTGYKNVVQTVTTLPNFISWVIMYAIVSAMLSNNGLINTVLMNMGIIDAPMQFMARQDGVWVQMWLYSLWKNLGWSAIVYIAAIAGIDQELYEAAMIDGAGRFRRMLHITLPGVIPTYFVLLIMSIGNFLNTGMEQFYIFQNAMNRETIQVLDLYVYNQGLASNHVPYATAVGILKSLVALTLFTFASALSKAVRGTSVF